MSHGFLKFVGHFLMGHFLKSQNLFPEIPETDAELLMNLVHRNSVRVTQTTKEDGRKTTPPTT